MRKGIIFNFITILSVMSLAACGIKQDDSEVQVVYNAPTTEQTTEVITRDEENTTEAAKNDLDDTEKETDAPASDTIDYEAAYAPVFEEYLDVINNGYEDDYNNPDKYKYASIGIMEELSYADKDTILDNYGYIIEDISGDGIPELLLGYNTSKDINGEPDLCYVIGGFTYKDGKPVRFLDGWRRSSYCWAGDGKFNYTGSGGAMLGYMGGCHISEDGTQLIWDDLYINCEDEFGEIVFYHNNTGEYDTMKSDKIDLTNEEFRNLSDVYNSGKPLSLTPLRDYKGGGISGTSSEDTDSESPVSVKWADDVVGDSTDYISYEPDNSDEYTRHVLFSTNKEVKNFRIVEVFIKGSDDEGNLDFLYEERYKLDVLTPEKPLCAGMNFPGDIPNNGFVYTDENGKDRVFIVSESGKDGSLFVSEYE